MFTGIGAGQLTAPGGIGVTVANVMPDFIGTGAVNSAPLYTSTVTLIAGLATEISLTISAPAGAPSTTEYILGLSGNGATSDSCIRYNTNGQLQFSLADSAGFAFFDWDGSPAKITMGWDASGNCYAGVNGWRVFGNDTISGSFDPMAIGTRASWAGDYTFTGVIQNLSTTQNGQVSHFFKLYGVDEQAVLTDTGAFPADLSVVGTMPYIAYQRQSTPPYPDADVIAVAESVISNYTFTPTESDESLALLALVYEQELVDNFDNLAEGFLFGFTLEANNTRGIKGTATGYTGFKTDGAEVPISYSKAGAVIDPETHFNAGFAPSDYLANPVTRTDVYGLSAHVYGDNGTGNNRFIGSQYTTSQAMIQCDGTDSTFKSVVHEQFATTSKNDLGGHYPTIQGDLIAAGDWANNFATIFRGARRDKVGLTPPNPVLAPSTAHWQLNAAGVSHYAGMTASSLFFGLPGFDVAAWRASLMPFLRKMGNADAGRARCVIFGDSNSDAGALPNVSATEIWHYFLAASSNLNVTDCVSGKGLGRNYDDLVSAGDIIADNATSWASSDANDSTANTIIVMGGTNDCLNLKDGIESDKDVVVTRANAALDEVVAAAKTRGVMLYLSEILPMAGATPSGHDPADYTRCMDARVEINTYINSLAGDGVKVLSISAVQGSDYQGYAQLVESYKYDLAGTPDATHLNAAGQAALAGSFISQIESDGSTVG